MDEMKKKSRGVWAQAAYLAEMTPESRNRYVDFLRALSILAVVGGHWLLAAPHFAEGQPRLAHMLDVSSWTQWLTWVLQVMPVFFFVGGFSNGTSWSAALRKGTGYATWLDSRLRRLIGPVLPLLLVWAIMAAVARFQGVSEGMIRIGSQVALVPVWFLAVYMLVIVFVPLTYRAWQRFGMLSFWLLVFGAVLVDIGFFVGGLHWLGWLNYIFVWLAVHQLGYAWFGGKLSGIKKALPWFLLGLPLLVILTKFGPYPLSLVGVPTDEISNTLPPKVPLLALAAWQIGFLLTIEKPMRRLLANTLAWTVTVLINGMIMTIFLWHSTVMILLIGLGFWVLPTVHSLDPASGMWWAFRPVWIAIYAAVSLPFIAVFARFERPNMDGIVPVAPWRLLIGCATACGGLAMLALAGVGSSEGWLGLRIIPLVLPFFGAGVAGFGPLSRLLPGSRAAG